MTRIAKQAVLVNSSVLILLFATSISGADSQDESWKDRIIHRAQMTAPVFQKKIETLLPPPIELEISIDRDAYKSTNNANDFPKLQFRIRSVHQGVVYLFCSDPPRISAFIHVTSKSFNTIRLDEVPNASEIILDVSHFLKDRIDELGAVSIQPGETIEFEVEIPELFWPVVPPLDTFVITAELRSTHWVGNRVLSLEENDIRWSGRTARSNSVAIGIFEN